MTTDSGVWMRLWATCQAVLRALHLGRLSCTVASLRHSVPRPRVRSGQFLTTGTLSPPATRPRTWLLSQDTGYGEADPDSVGCDRRLEAGAPRGSSPLPTVCFQGQMSTVAPGKHKLQICMNILPDIFFSFKNIHKATDHKMKNSMCACVYACVGI